MTNPVYQASMRIRAKVLSGERRVIAPQWRFQVGEAVRYVRPDDTDNEHYGQSGAIVERFSGYEDENGKGHDTHGGCYSVVFQCGCRSNLFEHWLVREGEERASVQ
jgi:hypothetical protein